MTTRLMYPTIETYQPDVSLRTSMTEKYCCNTKNISLVLRKSATLWKDHKYKTSDKSMIRLFNAKDIFLVFLAFLRGTAGGLAACWAVAEEAIPSSKLLLPLCFWQSDIYVRCLKIFSFLNAPGSNEVCLACSPRSSQTLQRMSTAL